MGDFIPVQTDMTDLGGRNHPQHRVQHTAARAQDRNQSQLSAGDLLRSHRRHRGFDLYILEGQISGRLIAHQHGDLGDQLAEFLGTGVLITQDRQLVLDQRMVKNRNFTVHNESFFLLS